MLAMASSNRYIITQIQENLQILLDLWATATPTKPDRADTLPILNRVTPENRVKITPKIKTFQKQELRQKWPWTEKREQWTKQVKVKR